MVAVTVSGFERGAQCSAEQCSAVCAQCTVDAPQRQRQRTIVRRLRVLLPAVCATHFSSGVLERHIVTLDSARFVIHF